ncbi:DUF6588 family protein [Reichenbachiella ulvae]|uniref:MetA-pathway of phenol degradation n=1 Tax=Reichenbachiella ulvae TaxID=2980104 RepID=A0ABT3CVX5_9BACT|nr:DUF6588 family protein [Reichenbachiella ulvae]MCV9387721.1 hypothetical protein [Reichenbachiella ulvae]
MKLNLIKRGSLLMVGCMLGTTLSNAQDLGDMTAFLQAGSEDASTYMGNYLSPVFKGFGYGTANGWYNTAKAHKPLGFDLTFTLNTSFVPDKDLFFDIVETDYNNVTLVDPNNPTTSTLFGDETTTTISSSYDHPDGTVSAEFQTAAGLGLNDSYNGMVPAPMIQLGIGLIKNTDLKVRWMPTLKGQDDYGNESRVSMFGFGLMHDFKQWIPAIKHIPVDMAVMVGYNRINSSAGLWTNGDVMTVSEDAEGSFAINSWTYQLLVSKKLSVLTVYGGLGYNDVRTNLNLTGDYTIDEGQGIVLTDPIDEKFDSKGMRGTLGLRLKLAVITIHTDYTFQEYNTLTAGIGVSIR